MLDKLWRFIKTVSGVIVILFSLVTIIGGYDSLSSWFIASCWAALGWYLIKHQMPSNNKIDIDVKNEPSITTDTKGSNQNIAECKPCHKTVSKKAKLCPHCGERKPYKKLKKKTHPAIYVSFALVGVFVVIVNNLSNSYEANIQTQNQQTATNQSSLPKASTLPPVVAQNPEDKIADRAISPITKKSYPKTYAKWGAANIKKINGLLKPAALIAAKSSSCDTVDIIDLSNNRSKPPNRIVFYADCVNGERFYISEADIKNDKPAISKQNTTKNISDIDATNACKEEVKAILQFPSSFDRKAFTTAVYRAPAGNIAITFDFDAKNGMGLVLPQKARCVIDDRGINPPEISNR